MKLYFSSIGNFEILGEVSEMGIPHYEISVHGILKEPHKELILCSILDNNPEVQWWGNHSEKARLPDRKLETPVVSSVVKNGEFYKLRGTGFQVIQRGVWLAGVEHYQVLNYEIDGFTTPAGNFIPGPGRLHPPQVGLIACFDLEGGLLPSLKEWREGKVRYGTNPGN